MPGIIVVRIDRAAHVRVRLELAEIVVRPRHRVVVRILLIVLVIQLVVAVLRDMRQRIGSASEIAVQVVPVVRDLCGSVGGADAPPRLVVAI